MRILHICNDYLGSKVHRNLYLELDNLHINQIIFCPVRYSSKVTVSPNLYQNAKVIFSKKTNKKHRVFFNNKIDFLYEDLKNKVDVNSISQTHATTLFSDGALALKLYKEYKIPYIVAVRGTDINLFMKYRCDLHKLGNEILTNANNIVFISESLLNNYHRSLFAKKNISIKNKESIIPNGLDSFWLKNINSTPKQKINIRKFLFIGKFDYNKNAVRLIKAFLKLSYKFEDIQLTLVGSYGSHENEVKALSLKHSKHINFLGPIFDKEKLLQIYNNHDVFSMVSISETFGLVYLEALSQRLPIVYTQGQGIDGTFDNIIGVKVNPKSINSIAEGIETIIRDFNTIEIDRIDFSKFKWSNIAKKYETLYNKIK